METPRGQGTRPTPDRVREALFAILGPLREERIVDLYAGTGALGCEALSRGAARAVFVEFSSLALLTLRRNLAALDVESVATVIPKRVESAASLLLVQAPFDLVFADPPYEHVRNGYAAHSLTSLLRAGLLRSSVGRLVLEHASRDEAPALAPLDLFETRRFGDTSLSFYAT